MSDLRRLSGLGAETLSATAFGAQFGVLSAVGERCAFAFSPKELGHVRRHRHRGDVMQKREADRVGLASAVAVVAVVNPGISAMRLCYSFSEPQWQTRQYLYEYLV